MVPVHLQVDETRGDPAVNVGVNRGDGPDEPAVDVHSQDLTGGRVPADEVIHGALARPRDERDGIGRRAGPVVARTTSRESRL